MRVRFWRESTRDTKNACDTVVAHFLLFPPTSLPRAFPAKARSHFPITALGFVGWGCRSQTSRARNFSNSNRQSLQCLSGGDDLNPFKRLEHQQILITRNDQICSRRERAGQNGIIVGVAANAIGQQSR